MDSSDDSSSSLTTQIVLHDTDVAFYESAKYRNLRLSLDDRFLYAMEDKSNDPSASLVYFEYNQTTGRYDLKGQAIADSSIDGGITFELSNDGLQIYASSSEGIRVLSRDPSTGLLTFQSALSPTDISDSFYPDQISIDPLGRFVHIGNSIDNNIASFLRSSTTGELTFNALQKPAYDRFILELLPSPDGNHLYIVFDERIIVAGINGTSGGLSFGQAFSGSAGTSDTLTSFRSLDDAIIYNNDTLLFLANSSFSYADGSFGRFISIVVTQRNAASGELSYVKSVDIEASMVGAIFEGTIINNPATEFTYVFYTADNPGQTSVNRLIKLQGAPLSGGFSMLTSNPVDALDIYGTVDGDIKSDGSSLLISAKRNEGGGITEITPDDTITDNNIVSTLQSYSSRVDGLDSAAHIVTSRDGRNIYIFTDSLDPTVISFRLDPSSGNLTYINTLRLRSSQFLPELRYLDIGSFLKNDVILDSAVISPDDRNLLILASNQIISLQRNLATGELSRMASAGAGIYPLWSVTGTNIPVSDVTFYNDNSPGFIAEALTISPDGRYIYATGLTNNSDTALSIVSRNTVTGELQLVGVLDTAIPSGERYSFPRGPLFPAITHDGEYLYLSNQNMALLLELKLDTSSGLVESLAGIQDGMVDSAGNTYLGLLNASAIRFSPDNRFIYLSADDIYSGYSPNTVSLLVLKRTFDSSHLDIVQRVERSDASIIDGDLFPATVIQGGGRTIDLSSDGSHLYMLTQKTRSLYEPMNTNGYSLDVFNIEPTTGKVNLVQRFQSGVAGAGISSIRQVPNSDYMITTNDRYGAVGLLTK
jgi:6-phosphogluconolactonase (cycloisomerase 2 family)